MGLTAVFAAFPQAVPFNCQSAGNLTAGNEYIVPLFCTQPFSVAETEFVLCTEQRRFLLKADGSV